MLLLQHMGAPGITLSFQLGSSMASTISKLGMQYLWAGHSNDLVGGRHIRSECNQHPHLDEVKYCLTCVFDPQE